VGYSSQMLREAQRIAATIDGRAPACGRHSLTVVACRKLAGHDVEDANWLIAKFKAAGLTDVHSQPYDLVPQWFPQSWEVTVAGNGKTISLDSAQPDYGATAPSPQELDLESSDSARRWTSIRARRHRRAT
jgi:hypothetical protein